MDNNNNTKYSNSIQSNQFLGSFVESVTTNAAGIKDRCTELTLMKLLVMLTKLNCISHFIMCAIFLK